MQTVDMFSPDEIKRHGPLITAFLKFHEDNPRVYWELVEMAFRLKRQGVRKYSMRDLFGKLRWDASLQTKGDEYKLNNNHTAYYSRLIEANNAELKGFFSRRSTKESLPTTRGPGE